MTQAQIPQHMFDMVRELPDPQMWPELLVATSEEDEQDGRRTVLVAISGPARDVKKALTKLIGAKAQKRPGRNK